MSQLMSFDYDLKLSQSDLQTIIEKKFPYEKKRFLSTLKIFNPVVILRENSNKLFIATDVNVNILEKLDFKASSLLSGELKFDNKTNDFYLHNFKIDKLETKKLPADVKLLIVENLEKLVNYALKEQAIYHLDKKILGTVASKLDIEKVEVKEKNMIITLKVF